MAENVSFLEAKEQRSSDESDLVCSAQKGDTQAFERLYRKHVGRIYAICLRMSGDSGHAEDFTQEVFIRTWEKLGSFQHRSSFSTWLYRLAVNLVLSHKQFRDNKNAAQFTSEDIARVAASGMQNPDKTVDLERAIASLPSGARTVFVLHDIEGYGHAEIAHLTQTAEGTSKAHLHWARKTLRSMLEK
jgi:RNA polymerase sigma-70 factor (ECF subfamily)